MKIVFASIVLFAGVAAAGQVAAPSAPNTKALARSGSKSSASDSSHRLEVLSDTMGVYFGPYLNGVVSTIRKNWFSRIPAKALPPAKQPGKVTIEFAIEKSGGLNGVAIDGSSGDGEFDRAALNGITASDPFPALPAQFPGSVIKLRIYFYYNPSPDERFPGAPPKVNYVKGNGR